MNRILFGLLSLVVIVPVFACSGADTRNEESTAPVEATMVYYRMPG